jgi:hypothetical protein
VLTPYPFDVDPLVVSFTARLVPRRSYASPEEFLQHFYGGERIFVTHTLSAA